MAKAGDKPLVLGFLTVCPSTPGDGGLRGGYLLTNEYGRPLEFHFTSELRLTRQQILLHGARAETYLHAEVLAKPLTDKQGTPPRVVLVGTESLLALRKLIPAPVLYLRGPGPKVTVSVHRDFPGDSSAFAVLETLVPTSFDWLEPFERIEQALDEVRESDRLVA